MWFLIRVGFFLSLQLPCQCGRAVASGTSELLSSHVHPYMLPYMFTVVECLVTLWAGRWLFPCMLLSSVRCQTALLMGWSLTYGADKWLLACMGPFVVLRVGPLQRCLAVTWTDRRHLSCVGASVCCKVGTRVKFLVVFVADRWLIFGMWFPT